MRLIAGISLKNLKPRVWDPTSPLYLPGLDGIMVSFADFHKNEAARHAAMSVGLHRYLNVPTHMQIFLDNGAFYFLGREGETPREEYEVFVAQAKPDWWPIPQDYIPVPQMSDAEQQQCYERTMAMNLAYQHDGFVPVIHICRFLDHYMVALASHDRLAAKPLLALGGIVPNLLRSPKALAYETILVNLRDVRQTFREKQIHIFGVGGTATLHIAALLAMDSVDSSGWRNRAARGLIQLPGTGDRIIANLGGWRGRQVSDEELMRLAACQCPACRQFGVEGLQGNGVDGFERRATHNLWVLIEEIAWIERNIAEGTYAAKYRSYLDNSNYLRLIDMLVNDPRFQGRRNG